jgi:2-haloacid dehalogenase
VVIVFDLNGTLLDSRALDGPLHKIFGGKLTAQQWFYQLLQYSMAFSLAGDYRPFDDVAAGVLEMAAAAHGMKLSSRDVQRVKTRFKSLPPYGDVDRALRKLKRANYRMAVLTNSTRPVLAEQLKHSRLSEYFEQTISVDEVQRYKPSPEVYKFAVASLGIRPDEMLMVAAHAWDLFGAAQAGCLTAFIRRPGQALFPNTPTPTYTANNLAELAARLDPSSTRSISLLGPALVTVGAAAVALAGSMCTARTRCQ